MTLDDAIAIVQRSLEGNVTDRLVGNLIVDLCDAADTGVSETFAAELSALPVSSTDELESSIEAIGHGAEAYCPDEVDGAPTLLNDAYAAAAPLVAATSTTVAAPATTQPPAATVPVTTKAPGTTKPATVTTNAPAATNPPTTQPTGGGTATAGSFCSPLGKTGMTSGGVPMTCSAESCAGVPYEQPRWHKTVC